jgi:hypothetical protein
VVEWAKKNYIGLFNRPQTILNYYSSNQEGLAPAAGALRQREPLIVAFGVVSLRSPCRRVVHARRGIGPGARRLTLGEVNRM